MRHSVVVILAVICVVIGEGWAQNRGSARYVPPEDFEGDVTRAPRPTRGGGIRRQRPTKAPEPAAVEEEPKNYQSPETPSRTTARRVPQRGSSQQVAPPPPPPLPLPVEEPAPLYPATVEELPQVPPATPEGRPQGTRRRRPKKRRRPSAAPKVEEPEKQSLPVPDEEKIAVSELNDKKRNEYQSNPQSRNASPTYDPEPTFNPERTAWDEHSSSGAQVNAAGPQYFRPQPPTNRLPVEEAGPVGNSRRYVESSPVIPDVDSPAPYVPKRPQSSVSNEASYVPVLSPVRVPSQSSSRLPPEDYTGVLNKETPVQEHPSDIGAHHRGHGNRSPAADPNEIIRNTGAKPVHNVIPQPNEPSIPVRGHSEVRLPQDEQPLISEYVPPAFDSKDAITSNEKASEEIEGPPNTSNRLPNPSEIHYDSVYPEFSERPTRGSQRVAGRRQEHEEPIVRNPAPSYTAPQRNAGTQPHEYDNDAEIDRRQPSQYRPPLQRGTSRYQPEESEAPSRPRNEEYTPPTNNPRTRGSSRYQEPADDYVPERTRSSTRSRTEPVANPPSRSRSSSTSQSTQTRGSQRYVPDTNERAPPRTSTRRQPINTEPPQRNVPSGGYIPIDEVAKNEQRSPPSRPQIQPTEHFRAENQEERNTRNQREEIGSLRNTLRSRPQYEARDVEPENAYEESEEDHSVYEPEYQVPRQPPTRGRTNERATVARQPSPQPEYQIPQNRQQNRPEPHYAPPQNPRSRHQPQYEAPQNPRSDARQNPPSSSRPQGRSRQSTGQPPAAAPSRSSGSNFACPDAFGFFADPVQCDKYYECRNGTAEMHLCSDGLAFNEISAPKFLRCDSLRDVDCKSRSELQEPQPSKNCPRRFGLFPHETDCTKFWNCVDGAATEVQCPPGLTYNDERATCDWADLVESSCKTEDLLGFTCPEPTAFDLQDGVYTRYPHPSNCQLHFTCIKGADGLRRPRMLSCNEGLVFDPATASCSRPDDVPGCEDFYGDRRPAPRRKPSRQPEPEEDIEEEPPTPRPSRRGSSNRRVRN